MPATQFRKLLERASYIGDRDGYDEGRRQIWNSYDQNEITLGEVVQLLNMTAQAWMALETFKTRAGTEDIRNRIDRWEGERDKYT